MPVPAHVKTTFTGVFGNITSPVEQWSFSINTADGVFVNQVDRENVAEAIADAWGLRMAVLHPPHVHLTRVRVAQVAAGGLVSKTVDGAYQQGDWEGDKQGSGVSQVLPIQTAVVVSLGSNRSGPSGKGRFFLPAPSASIGSSDFRMTQEATDLILARSVALLGDIDGILGSSTGGSGAPVIVSTKGFVSPVTNVRVGRVMDTMRSRRSSQLEGYVETPVNF